MALFNLGKKKEEKKNCCCSCGAPKQQTPAKGDCCGKPVDGICCIKVLGAGCASCHQQLENVKKAVESIGLSIEVEYVTDMAKIMDYGIMSMPAIVVNEKVVSMGKVLKAADVEKILGGLI